MRIAELATTHLPAGCELASPRQHQTSCGLTPGPPYVQDTNRAVAQPYERLDCPPFDWRHYLKDKRPMLELKVIGRQCGWGGSGGYGGAGAAGGAAGRPRRCRGLGKVGVSRRAAGWRASSRPQQLAGQHSD